MSKVELIATATFAMESVVAHELRQLGYTEQRVENNEVRFGLTQRPSCAATYGCVRLIVSSLSSAV